jgi:DNA-binding NtrC family response regulator
MRILLVDDEQPILMTLAGNFELDGFEVRTAARAEAAIELFRREPFDLVLSDVRMPGMNGLELFRRIREIRSDCPFVLMTGFALEGLVHDAIVEGVFTVLAKPFDVQDVVSALTRAARDPIVLVVEGDGDTGCATAEALRASHVRAAHESDVEQAIDTVRQRVVDVCVVDMDLGGGDALRLMDRVREVDPAIVFIAVAGHDAPRKVREAAARGSFACLHKPVNPPDLTTVIARARSPRKRASGGRPSGERSP